MIWVKTAEGDKDLVNLSKALAVSVRETSHLVSEKGLRDYALVAVWEDLGNGRIRGRDLAVGSRAEMRELHQRLWMHLVMSDTPALDLDDILAHLSPPEAPPPDDDEIDAALIDEDDLPF